jgi:AraC-like DNA-binding protein
MHTIPRRTIPAAPGLSNVLSNVREVDFCPPGPACSPATLAAVSLLLSDAEACLALDCDSACRNLVRALDLLHQANDGLPREGRGPGGLIRWQIKRLNDYIDTHLDTRIRTEDLAAVLQLSPGHFSHAFKQAMGIPPLAHVARRRIQAAREMMLSTDEPLIRIAHLHGFCDQSHFTRIFRRETGIAPQAWRKIRAGHLAEATAA